MQSARQCGFPVGQLAGNQVLRGRGKVPDHTADIANPTATAKWVTKTASWKRLRTSEALLFPKDLNIFGRIAPCIQPSSLFRRCSANFHYLGSALRLGHWFAVRAQAFYVEGNGFADFL